MTPPEYKALDDQALEELKATGVNIPYEKECIRKDGSRVAIIVGAAMLDEDKHHGVAFVLDISQRKRIEQVLQFERTFLRNVIDTTPSMIFVKDWNGRFVLVKESLARAYGTTIDDIVGKSDADFNANPEEVSHFLHDDREVMSGRKKMWIREEPVTHADGETRWYSTIKAPLIDAVGTCNKVLGVAADITERRHAQEDLQQLADELKRSNQDLEQFAAIASHDLRGPLRVVGGFAKVLREKFAEKLGEDGGTFLAVIEDSTERMSRLIDELLAYSCLGTHGKKPQRTDAGQILQTAIKDQEFCIADSGAIITCDHLPALWADETQLSQLFTNLLGNALKFRKKDELLRIHVGVARQQDRWRFSIQDNGIGLDPKHAEKIFVMFHRLHCESAYPGAGLGLAICKKIVERHGGKIWVESEPGNGSTFFFTIPDREAQPV
jgi:PAS domain S-box-containing protein